MERRSDIVHSLFQFSLQKAVLGFPNCSARQRDSLPVAVYDLGFPDPFPPYCFSL